MRVRIHLIAMPWAPPESPSIQIGCLKAHLDRVLQGRSDCHTYSAFFSILHDFRGSSFQQFFYGNAFCGEYVYQALHLRRFGPAEFHGRSAIMRLLKALREPSTKSLSLSVLNGLERATCKFLDRHVAPHLIARGLNLVGFTLNYDQVYSSLYAAEYLRRHFPERHFLFVYGGCNASLPNVYDVLRDLGVSGVIVVGEGEKKLELLVRTLGRLPVAEARTALAAVAGLDPGIIVIGEEVDLGSRNPAHYASQFSTLKELALPDYGEYFAALRRACADEKTYAASRAATDIFVEGSRGCFGKCDFCAMNRIWYGFRKRTADQIVHDTLAMSRKYCTSHIVFADSVCDAWAEDYARMLMQRGIRQQSIMELRASHREQFWTLLALVGVEGVQVGVEALSSPLLRAIGKGTRAVQNLAAHKYLAELDIKFGSNLMTHHPASTLADIRETRRILKQIPHWGPFRLTKFRLMAGSPLYEGLNQEERAALRPIRSFRLPPRAARYAIEYSFGVPEKLKLGRDVTRAWSLFKRQYERAAARHEAQRPRLDVARVAPDVLRITDTRDGKMLSYDFSGAAARIYDACHCGLKLDEIVQATGLSPQTVKAKLARFMRLRLVLRVDDDYLSLAMRPRDELLRRFLDRSATEKDAPGQRENYQRPDRPALPPASFQIPRLLRSAYISPG
jgi:radical SAM superfamily enzyme YgiQ (UPF0313 family)